MAQKKSFYYKWPDKRLDKCSVFSRFAYMIKIKLPDDKVEEIEFQDKEKLTKNEAIGRVAKNFPNVKHKDFTVYCSAVEPLVAKN